MLTNFFRLSNKSVGKVMGKSDGKSDGEVDGESLQKKKNFLSLQLKQFLDIFVTPVSHDHVIQI
jgi:hypothetical protein